MRYRIALLSGVLFAAPPMAVAQDMAPVALNGFSTPPPSLTGARITNQHGYLLGRVTQVQTDASGRPAALAFRPLDGKQVVVIGAGAVSFDGATAVADDNQPQIAALSTRLAAQ